ncbi:MAG: hypothetical protein ACOYMA_05810 [Bacteroidia bacterium]
MVKKIHSKYLFLLIVIGIYLLALNPAFAQNSSTKNNSKISKKPKEVLIKNSPTNIPLKTSVNEIFPGSLNGVEMFYKPANEGEIEIFLVKYFNCNSFKIDSSETVTVQETVATMLTAKPILKYLSEQEITATINANCVGYKNGCIKKITYSGKVKLMSPMMGGYDITWGYCCWNESSLTNIEGMLEHNKQGLSLTLHIPELVAGEVNSSPVFMYPPVLYACKNQLIAIKCEAKDENNDSLTYELSQLNDYKTKNNITNQTEPKVYPGQPINQSFAGGRPPFKKILNKKGFDYLHPLSGKQVSIDAKTGEIQLKAEANGEYLIGVSVNEYRSKKLIGTYQRVFKINIVD